MTKRMLILALAGAMSLVPVALAAQDRGYPDRGYPDRDDRGRDDRGYPGGAYPGAGQQIRCESW